MTKRRRLIILGLFTLLLAGGTWYMVRSTNEVDALVNAGVVAQRAGDLEGAASFWERALVLDPSLAHVHLYVAELRDGQGRPEAALPYYRTYLELVVEQRKSGTPPPQAVVPIVIKFADALQRAGHPDEAKAQFEVAAKMAARTGLKDLETVARQRLEQSLKTP